MWGCTANLSAGQKPPHTVLLLYEAGTLPSVFSTLSPYEKSRFVPVVVCRTHRPSGWGPSTTWTLWCPPLTVMGHSVVTVVESWSQDLSFCYLAGIGAASWKNIVKDFDVAQQE